MMNRAPENLSTREVYDLLKNINPETVVLFNQHIQQGTEIKYFPTDVLNGEMRMPPQSGHEPFRTVDGKVYYLPFEYEICQQQRDVGGEWKSECDYADYVWFTYGTGRSFEPSFLKGFLLEALRRGTSNVLISCAPDYSGRFRPEDAAGLIELGKALETWIESNKDPAP